MQKVRVKNFTIGKQEPLTVICGPCMLESEEGALRAADELKSIFSHFPFQFIFKSSYDKANRSSGSSFRGMGLEKGLRILARIKREFDLPILTDVHTPEEALIAGQVCDVIQIPAFLCRQTDLLQAAGRTGCVVNVKKGQFVAPWDMHNVVEKILATGNNQILLTERGFCFGYNNLISDMRAIAIMQKLNFPVFFDGTHSVQLPGSLGTETGGQREFIPLLIRASIASGCNGIFMEAHPNPSEAQSDKSVQLSFKELPSLLEEMARLYQALHYKEMASEGNVS